MTDVRVTPQSWLWRPRSKPIRFIEIHATRGNTSPVLQKPAALNWVQSPNNTNRDAAGNPLFQWGSSFSHVIGTDGSEGTVLDDDQMPTFSAGFGGPNSTWAIDEYGISYELAQSQAQEPFSNAIYERAAKEIAIDCKAYGIPPVMVEVFTQSGPVPTGIVRHDRTQNGVILGKTDPGNQFDEVRFISMLKAEMEDDVTPEEVEAIVDAKLKPLFSSLGARWDGLETAAAVLRLATANVAGSHIGDADMQAALTNIRAELKKVGFAPEEPS